MKNSHLAKSRNKNGVSSKEKYNTIKTFEELNRSERRSLKNKKGKAKVKPIKNK